jgi:oligopeptide/dipeptide ABC transporter ATP-binding protein
MPLLEVSRLQKRFNLEAGFFARYGHFVNAVNDVSFVINKNEAYGLVGESGCGKTTTARLLVRMYDADSGSIRYYPENAADRPLDVLSLAGDRLRSYRKKIRYVFQDPARSLNPRMTVYEVLVSGLRWSDKTKPKEKQLYDQAAAALDEVGLSPDDLQRRPSEFSGGQRQRISIARGLLMQPRLLICDEVVSALDVSIQGQILNLLLDIREKRDISFLFIAHDLKVASYFCDRIGVMYSGELMEEAPAGELYRSALHPYTRLLFACAGTDAKTQAEHNTPDYELNRHIKRRADFDKGAENARRCAFAERCPQAMDRCFAEKPTLREIAPGHLIRCLNEAF